MKHPRRLHRAWIVAAAGFVVLLASAAIRATFGILMDPLMDEFGWNHTAISTAASVNLVVFGLSAPFAASFAERFGLTRVVTIALILIGVSAALITQVNQLWQLYLVWGLIAGAATGAVAPVLAAMISGRWFVEKRGLVLGGLTAANSTGQLIFLPLMAALIDDGWRWTMVVVGGAAVVALVLAVLFMRDGPAEGEAPYGGTPELAAAIDAPARPSAVGVLRQVMRDRVFLALAGSFFVCGATTVGLIAVHLIPAAHDHGISTGHAAGIMAAMGVLDIVGTTGSGWLTDRYDAGKLLIVYYTGRGVSLLILPVALAVEGPTLLAFTVFYGLDWIATVPPTVALVTKRFGRQVGTVAFGWIFAAHQLGGAMAAWAAGFTRDQSGSYDGVFFVSALLCFAAALLITTASGRRLTPAAAVPA
ncbi:L-lactate transporter [Paraconexibacter sp. AEG42_29]|uniref:L-lactate transporter n=1 Tax=Paraconexibacter sp. AEG42_29 TaxID=2997339 RepID=A0AAU7B2W2_9ACTN